MIRKHIIIIGNEGAGKSTQIQMLSEQYHLPVISAGAFLRSEIARRTAIGKKIRKFVNAGRLAPNDIVNHVIEREIAKHQHTGFILDGYPRDLEQIGFLFSLTRIDLVIGIIISAREVRDRILPRRQCKRGHVYHLNYFPPQKEGVCDIDGMTLFRRKDASESAIRHREEVFKQHTARVIRAFQNVGIYAEIDGEQGVEKVHRDIVKVLRSSR